MDISNMKNIVVLKNLPSNLIEEAIVVVKENKNLKKYQVIEAEKQQCNSEERQNKKSIKILKSNDIEQNANKNSKDYIIKEAEMLIENYIKDLENKSPSGKNSIKKIEKKYKKSIRLNYLLGFATLISLVISVI